MPANETGPTKWLDPWYPLEADVAGRLEAELQSELCPAHVLFGHGAQAIASRCDCDDILFRVVHPQAHYAVVHLTFQRETLPQWPRMQLIATFEEFVQIRLLPDAADYAR